MWVTERVILVVVRAFVARFCYAHSGQTLWLSWTRFWHAWGGRFRPNRQYVSVASGKRSGFNSSIPLLCRVQKSFDLFCAAAMRFTCSSSLWILCSKLASFGIFEAVPVRVPICKEDDPWLDRTILNCESPVKLSV